MWVIQQGGNLYILLFATIEQQGYQDDNTRGNAATRFRDAILLKHCAQYDQKDSPRNRAPVVTATTQEGSTADDHRCDTVEEIGITHAQRCLLPKRGQCNTRDSRKEATQTIDEHSHEAYIDTGKIGGQRIIAQSI